MALAGPEVKLFGKWSYDDIEVGGAPQCDY